MFCEPTPARPKRRHTPWPDHLDVRGGQDLTYRGQVRLRTASNGTCPGPVIGTVHQYNPASHTGKVILFAMQAEDRCRGILDTPAELGSLDPDWEVVQDGTGEMIPQRHTLVKDLVAELMEEDEEMSDSARRMAESMGEHAIADVREWVNTTVRAHADDTDPVPS
jgi:hypothetical protein